MTPLKGYVVTLFDMPQSVTIAIRCIDSGKKFKVDVGACPAVDKTISRQELAYEGLGIHPHDTSYSDSDAVLGNFVSQYRIWKLIVHRNEPGIVLEHDAVFVDFVPNLENQGDIINLGKPSYGRFNVKDAPGVYNMFSKTPVEPYGAYIPGAHGYYVTPKGAQQLINKAKEIGAAPCDMFLCSGNFPDIKELYPWVIEAHDSFTTIQKERGCNAKHNYQNNKKNYKILT